MIVLMEYLDTAKEDVDRIRKGRKNIQRGITAMVMLVFVVMFFIIISTIYFNYFQLIYFSILFVGLIVLLIGLVVKREIYSMMIFLKEREEKNKW